MAILQHGCGSSCSLSSHLEPAWPSPEAGRGHQPSSTSAHVHGQGSSLCTAALALQQPRTVASYRTRRPKPTSCCGAEEGTLRRPSVSAAGATDEQGAGQLKGRTHALSQYPQGTVRHHA